MLCLIYSNVEVTQGMHDGMRYCRGVLKGSSAVGDTSAAAGAPLCAATMENFESSEVSVQVGKDGGWSYSVPKGLRSEI